MIDDDDSFLIATTTTMMIMIMLIIMMSTMTILLRLRPQTVLKGSFGFFWGVVGDPSLYPSDRKSHLLCHCTRFGSPSPRVRPERLGTQQFQV